MRIGPAVPIAARCAAVLAGAVLVATGSPTYARAQAPAPESGAAGVALLVIGGDPAQAGTLQAELEKAIRPAVGAAAIARHAGVRGTDEAATEGIDRAVRARADALLADARRAYVEDRLVDALDALAALRALQMEHPFALAERVTLLIWRTSVLLAMDERARAGEEARKALALDPQLVVDLGIFRPSVAAFVDAVRGGTPRTVALRIVDTPPDAAIEIDGRSAGAASTVLAGTRRIVVRARGFRTRTRDLDVLEDTTLRMPLAPAVDPRVERMLRASVSSGRITEPARLAKLLGRIGAEALVAIVLEEGQGRAAYLRADGAFARTGAAAPLDPAAVGSLSAWTRTTLADPPRAPEGEPAVPGPASPSALHVATRVGVAFAARRLAVAGEAGDAFSGGFAGAGPRASVEASYGRWLMADAEGHWIDYRMPARVDRPDGTDANLGGGNTAAARIAAGGRWAFGDGNPRTRPWLGLLLGGAWERHLAEDLHDASGRVGLFPSSTRLAAELRLQGAVPAGPVRLHGGVAVALAASLSQTPVEAWGRDPRESPGSPAWQFGIDGAVAGVWNWSAAYGGEFRTSSFRGEARAPLDPRLADARVRETLQTVTLSIGRRF